MQVLPVSWNSLGSHRKSLILKGKKKFKDYHKVIGKGLALGMPPTELGRSPNMCSTASWSSVVRRKPEVCLTDATYPRMPAITDPQGNCPNDRPSCIIVIPIFWQATFWNKVVASRIQSVLPPLVIGHIPPGGVCVGQLAATMRYSVTLSGWQYVYNMCFLLTRSFPYISARNLIAALNESSYSKPNIRVAFSKL